MTNEKNQAEMARRLASIDRSVQQLVKIFDALNTNIVAAVKSLQEQRTIHSSVETLNVDPEQMTLGDKDKNGD